MYKQAKEAAKYRNTQPTLTDQSQADDTNLNVIIKKYAMTGQAPGSKMPIPAGDYTNSPTDLRGHLELARSVKTLQQTLPPHLQKLTLEQLSQLDNKQLAAYNEHMNTQTEAQNGTRPQQSTNSNNPATTGSVSKQTSANPQPGISNQQTGKPD